MGLILSVRGNKPSIGEGCYIAPNATIAGDVTMGNQCSVWFNAIVRGDVNSITLGNRVNIQDGAILHCTYEKSVIVIGDNVSVGHKAVIHGARIERNVLIGIGAIILDNAIIGENSIIAAGAVVLAGTEVPPGSIFGGVPARLISQIDKDQTREMIDRISENYILYSSWYQAEQTT